MKIYILLILCVLFWSGNFILGRFIHDEIEPIELSFLRWAGVCLVLLPYLIIHFKKIVTVTANNFLIMFAFAVLGITGFNTFLYFGLQDTTATNALLINSSVPMLIVFLSALILKQPISNKQIIAIVLSTLGVIYLVLKGDVSRALSFEFNPGDIWIILAGFSWAIYSILLKFKPKELAGMQFVTAIVFLGTFVLLILYILFGYSFSSAITHISNNSLILLYLIIFPSILSFIFWNKGVHEIGANKTGQFAHLMPLIGSFLAFVFLKETLELFHLIGMSFIGFGIYISLYTKKQ